MYEERKSLALLCLESDLMLTAASAGERERVPGSFQIGSKDLCRLGPCVWCKREEEVVKQFSGFKLEMFQFNKSAVKLLGLGHY